MYKHCGYDIFGFFMGSVAQFTGPLSGCARRIAERGPQDAIKAPENLSGPALRYAYRYGTFYRPTRQDLLQYIKLAPESLIVEIPDLDAY